uniref:Mediator of RNA polymerase II transcription subunit 20 n=1 Tax=Panagrolaimus sp. JU765 TaxID=591449 RepID=A0AC34Q3I5_9BILA
MVLNENIPHNFTRRTIQQLNSLLEGWSIVCGEVKSLEPLKIEDSTDNIIFKQYPSKLFVDLDYYIFLVKTTEGVHVIQRGHLIQPEILILHPKNDESVYDSSNLLVDIKKLRNRSKPNEIAFGVTWVVEVKESMKSLCDKILALGAVQKGTFRCDYVNYRPSTGSPSSIGPFSVFHHTNFPATTFMIANAEGKLIKASADRGFDFLLPKFKVGYTPDHTGSYESNGHVYHYRDFRIRIGVASQAKQYTKGAIVEIEYLPVTYIRTARPILIKFAESFLGDPKNRNPKTPPWHGNREFTYFHVPDIFVQYQTIFTAMRKRAGGTTIVC